MKPVTKIEWEFRSSPVCDFSTICIKGTRWSRTSPVFFPWRTSILSGRIWSHAGIGLVMTPGIFFLASYMLCGVNTRVNCCSKDLAIALDLGSQEGLRSPTLKIQTWNVRKDKRHEPEGPLVCGSSQSDFKHNPKRTVAPGNKVSKEQSWLQQTGSASILCQSPTINLQVPQNYS